MASSISLLPSPTVVPAEQWPQKSSQTLKSGGVGGRDRRFRASSLSGATTDELRRLLRSLPDPSPPFSYNTLIKAFALSGAHLDALRAYALMRARSVPPDPFTLPAVLRSAAAFPSLATALEAHGLAVKSGLDTRLPLRTALVGAYCSCGHPDFARRVFDRTDGRDAICYNTMIAGHVKCGEFELARDLFDRMPERNVSSWNTILDLYCKMGDVRAARRLFDEMPERNIVSWNAMISGHAKAGDFVAARELFDLMPERNVVSWNAVIGCYFHCGLFSETLDLFRMMQATDMKPNEVTVVAVLPACAHLGALDLGQWVHAYIQKQRIKMDLYVTAALVDMYGRCGSLEDARKVFDHAMKRDAFLCSTMIEVFAMHGRAQEAFQVFDFMRSEGIWPNDVTFMGILRACAHGGLVEFGLKYFNMMMAQFKLMPKVEHFGCMVDLLGRAGHLEEAHDLILGMPMEPPPMVWASLLSACKIHGNVKLAEEVAFHLIELEPQSCANYVVLSNMYSKANRWEDAAKIRRMMKEKGVVKKLGCSSIEVSNGVHEFLAGDKHHRHCKAIHEMLDQMAVRLKREGYVPCTSSALHDMDNDGREQVLLHHSEKLALAYGLISTDKGTTIRIFKNLRVCDDCHQFLKLASKHYDRQVIVRDCNRFHHFVGGSCSCSDYW
ncbi:pentatricopeptide repeat-containing protein At3g62890-like [Phoenix dactylifera]|uniref:Pentatricopeptide repeat-containing protein At3g62890-like n=1 Tax=Phoenix dactylifera TaxID=42345 RepID=A0A8B7BJ48_PHODC|nr:pentatricopeptide repeat-containing protein At3g62890-like [Phoenix dactylifera]